MPRGLTISETTPANGDISIGAKIEAAIMAADKIIKVKLTSDLMFLVFNLLFVRGVPKKTSPNERVNKAAARPPIKPRPSNTAADRSSDFGVLSDAALRPDIKIRNSLMKLLNGGSPEIAIEAIPKAVAVTGMDLPIPPICSWRRVPVAK